MASYNIDPAHSSADFSVRHMMITTVRGTFDDLSGSLEFDQDNPSNSSVEAVIKTASVSTRADDRDAHLKSADFFNVEEYPEMTFKSTRVEVTGENTGKVTGNLTIRDVSREVTFDVDFLGLVDSPFGDKRAGFSGTAKINREEWGLNWNMALETGGVLVGKDVNIHVDLQAVLQAEAVEA